MLLRVTIEEIEQRCDACGSRRTLPLAALRAGVEHGDQPMDPSVIALPVCPHCDAREFVMRVLASPQAGAPRSATTEHRRGVNALHHALVAAGRVAPSLADYFAGESLAFERAELPWAFTGDPAPIRRPDPATLAFSQFLAARNGGG